MLEIHIHCERLLCKVDRGRRNENNHRRNSSKICILKNNIQVRHLNSELNLLGKEMKKFCKDNNIKLSFANIYHPKTNG